MNTFLIYLVLGHEETFDKCMFSEAWWNSTWVIKAFCFMFLYQFGDVPFLDEILMMHMLRCAYLLSCIRLFAPKDCRPPGSSVHGDSPGKILEWVARSSSRGSSQPRNWTRSSRLQADSLLTEPPGKPSDAYRALQIKVFMFWFCVVLFWL